jgi:hypothetical protein
MDLLIEKRRIGVKDWAPCSCLEVGKRYRKKTKGFQTSAAHPRSPGKRGKLESWNRDRQSSNLLVNGTESLCKLF